jgi:hypothetical protein
MHDSSNCPICRGLPIHGSLSDEEFSAFLDICRGELAEKQGRFQKGIEKETNWHFDLTDCIVVIGDCRFGITPIGTHSAEQQTWLWAWANEDFPSNAREASRQLQSLHDVTGFRVFIDPGIGASSLDAQDFSALAAHWLNAIGFFRVPSNDQTLYLAVHDGQ